MAQPATSQVKEVALIRRIISLFTVAALMALMVALMAASPALAQCFPGSVAANDNAQGCWRTGALAAEDTPAAEKGIVTSFMHNTQP